jgi:hypothetical protein
MPAFPVFNALPVAETEVGLAVEAVRGTPVQPTTWLPIMGPKYKPDLQMLMDETLQGSMVKIYDAIPGLRRDGHGWDGLLYLDSFPNIVRGILGSSDTVTAAPASTTLNQIAAAGQSTISTNATVASGSFIVIDTGVGVMETHLTNGVSGSGPYTVTLAYPLAYNHAVNAAVTGLNKHQFSLLNNSNSTSNQPPSYTITEYAGDFWRQLPATQFDKLTISGSADALPKYTISSFSNAAVTPSTPSASFSTTEAAPGWTLIAAINGVQVAYVVSWEIEINRNVKSVPAVTGTQAYYEHFAGPIEATAKLVVLDDPSATQLGLYEGGNNVGPLDLTLYDVKSGYALNMHSTKAKYTTGELDRSKEYVEVPLDVQLLPSSTDALAGGVSPIVVAFGNAQTASY